MNISYHKTFVKHFDKRIKPNINLLKKYKNRYKKFIKDKERPLLKDHKLKGHMKGSRSFSITGDIRVIYRKIEKNKVQFLDIGTHTQVYEE